MAPTPRKPTKAEMAFAKKRLAKGKEVKTVSFAEPLATTHHVESRRKWNFR